MDPVTDAEIIGLFEGKTREQCLEIAIQQILGIFDSPIVRLRLKGQAYMDAIHIAKYALSSWEEEAQP